MNPGIENIRKRGSRIVGEGAHMLPAASLMMAEGVIRSLDDLQKPFVTIINSYTTQIPGHAHLDQLGAIAEAKSSKALGLQRLVHQHRRRRVRRHRHGALRHEVLAALARADRGPDRDHHRRAPLRRLDRHRQLRQDRAGHVQRHGAHQHPGGLRERRADAGRARQHRPDLRVRGRGQAQRGQDDRRRAAASWPKTPAPAAEAAPACSRPIP